VLLTPTPILEADAKVLITSYYRFAADPQAFSDSASPEAVFSNLPTNHVLTIQVDVPEPWNMQQTGAIQDTDNVRCDARLGYSDDMEKDQDVVVPIYEHSQVTKVEFGLKNLLIFGQCYETRNGNPPNGLQLTLSRSAMLYGKQLSTQNAEIGLDGSISQESSGDENEDAIYSDRLVMKNVGYWQLPANPGV
jgi:hypothetical protein